VSLTIGRTVLADPDDVKVTGDDVSFTVELDTTTVADMKAKRQRLANLVGNRDEEVVPVIWSEDSAFDGFYEPVSLSVPSQSLMLSNGYIPPLTVTLRRLGGGYANPTFEVTATNLTRTNGHALTNLAPVFIPSDTVTYDIDGFGSVALSNTRPTADGVTMQVLECGDPNGRSYRFDVAPADYYKATCVIELEIDGAWQVVTGRQVPRSSRFRMSNGLIRLTSASSSVGSTVEVWNGSSWVSFGVSFYGGSTAQAIGRFTPGSFGGAARDIPVSVLRNAPEQITLRQATFSDQITFSMLRGARHFSAHWTVSNNVTGPAEIGIGLTTAAGGFLLDAGVQSGLTSNASLIFATAAAETADTTNTRTRNTVGALSDTIFVGYQLTTDADLNSALSIQRQMMSGVNWRQRVVAR
jgi:hypothetical protein